MLLGYLQRRGWRLLYPPQRGKRGRTYCTVGKIITQEYLRETYFHNLIGAFAMELSRFPFSKRTGSWERPHPIAYRAISIGLPLGGWVLREVNGTLSGAVEALWRTQYIKRRSYYSRMIGFVVDWLARALWFIEVHGRPPASKHPIHGTLARRYEVGWSVADHFQQIGRY